MENKDMKIKLMAVQGILGVFATAKVPPKSIDPIESLQLMAKTLEAFKDSITSDTELEAMDELLGELLKEILD